MFLTENFENWQNIIKENLGVTDKRKLNWMSTYAMIHEAYERAHGIDILNESAPGAGMNGVGPSASGLFATPATALGMGNPAFPQGIGFNGPDGTNFGAGIGNTGADFHAPNYKVGSGDIPVSTLAMSLNVAAITIGLELVPVIPSSGPWTWLQFLETPYAGGKQGAFNETSFDGIGEGRTNKPLVIKIGSSNKAGLGAIKTAALAAITDDNKWPELTVESTTGTLTAKYLQNSRFDNYVIVEIVEVKDASDEDASIASIFAGADFKVKVAGEDVADALAADATATYCDATAEHVQKFANFAADSEDGMTRAQNETGVGNTIGIKSFGKLVQMEAFEVTGQLTRQQLQDLPLSGVDPKGQVLDAMQNAISQSLNNRILDRVFKLGTTNAENQKYNQGVNFNLFFSTTATSCDFKNFEAYKMKTYRNIANKVVDMGTIKNGIALASNADMEAAMQRRIMSRILAAKNLIQVTSRQGVPNWVVTNAAVASALQNVAGYVINPMANTLDQEDNNSLYFAGKVAGLSVYVDPNMDWSDCRVCVGRRSDGKKPGVIFMPYLLADSVEIIAEGTMAPKFLTNSRFAIVDAGFYPELNYYTFAIHTDDSIDGLI